MFFWLFLVPLSVRWGGGFLNTAKLVIHLHAADMCGAPKIAYSCIIVPRLYFWDGQNIFLIDYCVTLDFTGQRETNEVDPCSGPSLAATCMHSRDNNSPPLPSPPCPGTDGRVLSSERMGVAFAKLSHKWQLATSRRAAGNGSARPGPILENQDTRRKKGDTEWKNKQANTLLT